MSDLVEPVPIPIIVIDGWGERELRGGLYYSAGYQIVHGEKIVVVRVAQREETVRAAAAAATAVLDGSEPDDGEPFRPRLAS